ncbi:hypothetical protein F8388_014063 [Cannabis sativa]|uniref:Uncharacterized protein n=1 Tax=Cannabis sativa TaxID=3483 RepID=A0A7J6GL14_CANSA|nr:hypothetical protein F8388_014063 [Cannabis sativa]
MANGDTYLIGFYKKITDLPPKHHLLCHNNNNNHNKSRNIFKGYLVTELKCGGIVVACTFDHRIVDAYSANMFFISWVQMAQSKRLSLRPSFRRSLLNPRRHQITPTTTPPLTTCTFL